MHLPGWLATDNREKSAMQALRDHTRVNDRSYPSNQHAPYAARGFVRRQFVTWGIPDLTDVAALVTDELVTNAVTHAQGNIIGVQLEYSGELVTVRVKDERPDMLPEVPQNTGDDLAESGRGLALVDALSLRWGWYGAPRGKVVWSEIGDA